MPWMRMLCSVAAVWLAACSLVVDGALDDEPGPGEDGGSTIDGGPSPDGSRTDGGPPPDGGAAPDGGASSDGGSAHDGSSASDGGAADGGPSPDGGELCPVAHRCVPSVPDGWSGPFALFSGTAGAVVPDCDGAYPSDAGTFHGELDPGEVTCNCECDPATGIVCTGDTSLCFGSGSSFCFSLCTSSTAGPGPGECVSVPTSGTHVQVRHPTPSSHGSCSAREAHSLSPPEWGTVARACGGTSLGGGCGEDEACAPPLPSSFEDLCIARAGDVACPAATYPEKRLFHEGFEDTRTCSSCSCGGATSQCGGAVSFVNDSTAGACSILVRNVSSCGEHGGATKASYSPSPSGTCPPSSSSLSGEVTTSGTTTFCCRP